MRSTSGSWSRLHSDFDRQVRSPRFQSQFEALRRTYRALVEFSTPYGLVAHQHSRVPSHDDHDRVLHALISAYQAGYSHRETAGPLIYLSMHPALSCVLGRVLRRYHAKPDATSDVYFCFFEEVDRWNLAKTDRIARNLQLNTLRRVLEIEERECKDRQRVRDATVYADAVGGVAISDERGSQGGTRGGAELDAPAEGVHEEEPFLPETSSADLWRVLRTIDDPYEVDDHEIVGLLRFLEHDLELAKDDALLLVLKGPCHWCWSAIAAHLREKPETARKRRQKLRSSLNGSRSVMDRFPDFEIFPRVLG